MGLPIDHHEHVLILWTTVVGVTPRGFHPFSIHGPLSWVHIMLLSLSIDKYSTSKSVNANSLFIRIGNPLLSRSLISQPVTALSKPRLIPSAQPREPSRKPSNTLRFHHSSLIVLILSPLPLSSILQNLPHLDVIKLGCLPICLLLLLNLFEHLLSEPLGQTKHHIHFEFMDFVVTHWLPL